MGSFSTKGWRGIGRWFGKLELAHGKGAERGEWKRRKGGVGGGSDRVVGDWETGF
jgi:hypothetical protein